MATFVSRYKATDRIDKEEESKLKLMESGYKWAEASNSLRQKYDKYNTIDTDLQ